MALQSHVMGLVWMGNGTINISVVFDSILFESCVFWGETSQTKRSAFLPGSLVSERRQQAGWSISGEEGL